jgi:hypothetical protein
MAVVDLKRAKRAKRTPRNPVPLDKATGAARFFDRMVREIENDLGGTAALAHRRRADPCVCWCSTCRCEDSNRSAFHGPFECPTRHFGNGNVFIGGTELWRFGRARLCERHIRKTTLSVRLRSPNAGSLVWQTTKSIELAHAESVRSRSLSRLSGGSRD